MLSIGLGSGWRAPESLSDTDEQCKKYNFTEMQSETSEKAQKTNEQPDLCESRIKIRFVPLPPEKYEAYKAAIRWLWKLMREELEEQKSREQRIESSVEPSQVNNDPYPPALSPNQKTDLEKGS